MGKGTTLDDPVTVEQVPDIAASQQEIEEYFQEQKAYDIFDFVLKELMVKQPADPLDHMLRCLETEFPTGPLKVIVLSPPCLGRPELARRLAETFGLVYIGAGELLEQAGVATETLGLADEQIVVDLVLAKLKEATAKMQGWVLDGFPRTRFQTSFLKDSSLVPEHILLLKAEENQIRERMVKIEAGDIEGKYVKPEVLEEKLSLFSCHNMATLEVYQDRLVSIDTKDGSDRAFAEMAHRARMLPRSLAPSPPPRIVLLGPRGIGLREHASRLAARLGAVAVDAGQVAESTSRSANPLALRLGGDDCKQQGWVVHDTAMDSSTALALQQDGRLTPTRVVVLMATEDTCVNRLRSILHDPITGQMWMSLPKNETLRKRLIRKPEDQMPAVSASHQVFTERLPQVLEAFGNTARCNEIAADGAPLEVFNALVDFVERPLPLPIPAGASA